MVPLPDFDDPDAVRERCRILRTVGATSGGFPGLPSFSLDRGECERGQLARTSLGIPSVAPFFADHFPRRPVFPGTLLLHANLQTAEMLASEVSSTNGAPWLPRAITDVKLRSFISPGETLNLEARRTDCSETSLRVAVESRIGQRLVGSAGIRFSPGLHP